MKVRTKLIVLSTLGAGMTLVVTLVAMEKFSNTRRNMTLIQTTAAALRYQLEADMMHDALRADVFAALLAEDQAEHDRVVDDLQEHREKFRESIRQSNELDLSQGVQSALAEAREPLEAYILLAEEIVNAAGQDKAAARKLMQDFLAAFSRLEEKMEQVSDVVQADVSLADKAAQADLGTARYYIGATAAVSMMVMLCGTAWIVRSIHRRLTRCRDVLGRLANGDLTPRVGLDSTDEIGELGVSTDEMARMFHGILTELKASSDEVAAASGRIAAAAEETSSSNNHISDRAQGAGTKATQAKQTAQQGSELFTVLLNDMDRITTAVSSGARSVLALGNRGEQIGALVNVISDIADQTNLLALNAAIEAARAGEHGRGFAVVADEVRKLADRTGKATLEISESIKAIQTQTREAVEGMEQGQKRVEAGAAGARSVAEKMQGIVTDSDQVQEMVTAITAAAHEAGEGAAQSAQVATELATKARDLNAMVERFKIA